MAKRKFKNKLISIEDINEELRLIEESEFDYITISGNVYCKYGENEYFKRSIIKNRHNGYLYVQFLNKDGKSIQRRLHRLVAKAFIPNPNNLPVVMHIDNNKENCSLSNLKWGTVAENTQQAFDDGLQLNDSGFNDSQSLPVCQFNLNKELINIFGSISIASNETGVTKSGILYQCKHKVLTKTHKPKCGYYFRFLNEYEKKGFVL